MVVFPFLSWGGSTHGLNYFKIEKFTLHFNIHYSKL